MRDTPDAAPPLGLRLANGCHVVHGEGAGIKRPFTDIPLVMHELSRGGQGGFAGQFGVIPFTCELRLPRHVHIAGDARLVAERILVLNGVALVELNGEVLIVPPLALVTIAPGVPHTWTACPAGVVLPDGTASDGRFTMIYDYAEPTGFFPCAGTATLARASDYVAHTGELEAIRFPALAAPDLVAGAALVWNRRVARGLAALSATSNRTR